MCEKGTFCEECRSDVEYLVEEKMMNGKLKGQTYHYTGKRAICAECGSEVYVHEIQDDNLKALYDVYRKQQDLISLEMILEIPKKYDIGKRPLSLLLGWGEQTYTRYCEGDMPTKRYSDVLKKIYDSPEYYERLLEENKEYLKTSLSYEKTKRAVEKLLKKEESDRTKIDAVISYILHECEDITPLSLQKVLYYVQGFYYAFSEKFLFSDDCEAWVHGPVYREVYFKYREYRFDPIKGTKKDVEEAFTSLEKSILDSVVKYLCCYSGKVLEKFTHLEEPWLLTRGDLPDGAPSDAVIEKEIIGKYFLSVKEKYRMITTGDIQSYAQSMFQKI